MLIQQKNNYPKRNITFGQTRRDFLKTVGLFSAGVISGASIQGCGSCDSFNFREKTPIPLDGISHQIVDKANEIALHNEDVSARSILKNLAEASQIEGINKKVDANYIFAYLEGKGSNFSKASIMRGAKDLSYLHYKNPKALKSEVLLELDVGWPARKTVINNYLSYSKTKNNLSSEVKNYALSFPNIEAGFINDAHVACKNDKKKTFALINSVIEESNNAELKPNIVCALIKSRSNFNPDKESGGMKGLLLLHPDHYEGDLLNPKNNLKRGLSTFSKLLNKYGNYKEAVYSFVLGEKNYVENKYSKAEKKAIDNILAQLRDVSNAVNENVEEPILPKKSPEPSTVKVVPSPKRVKGKKLIVIDAGHGGSDPGAIGPKSLKEPFEKDVVLKIAKKLQKKLSGAYNVVMTRTTDDYVSLKDRAYISNKNDADFFISLHCNASPKKYVKGTETLAMSSKSLRFAQHIQQELISNLKTVDRKAHRPVDFPPYVLKYTKAPAVLVELGFISNKFEASNLLKNSTQNKMASSIAKAIKKFV